jgi:hypothetical protein
VLKYYIELQQLNDQVLNVLKKTKPEEQSYNEFDLRWIKPWGDDTWPKSGKKQVFVATDNDNKLRIRIFDEAGNLIQDKVESQLRARAKEVKSLKQQLSGMSSPPDKLKEEEKAAIIEAVTSIVGKIRYDEAQAELVRPSLDKFLKGVQQFRDVETALSGYWKTEPLLPPTSRTVCMWVALSLFGLGTILAAFGTAYNQPGLVTASRWSAFASLALWAVWLLAYLVVRRPSAPLVQTAKPGLGLQYLVFGGLAFLVLAFLSAGVLTGGLLEFLSSVRGARGLITFLIAIGTIAIAVILTLASVIMEATDTDALKERLSKGKEILTVLVGVLGTIVGFYFASNPDGSVPGKMTVTIVDVTPRSVEPDTQFDVLAMTTGGQLPYKSTPIIKPSTGLEGTGSVNEQGLIKVKFKVAKTVTPGQKLEFEVGASDNSEKRETGKGTVEVVTKK